MTSPVRLQRLRKELERMESSPTPGICVTLLDESRLDHFSARIMGPPGTPFEGGVFQLSLHIPERYPFEPPQVQFVTPIYHPNIDSDGRICHDILKMPPQGGWKPSLNISQVLLSIRLLMSQPDLDDPLVQEIASELRQWPLKFDQTAREWTRRYGGAGGGAGAGPSRLSGPAAPPAAQTPAQALDTDKFMGTTGSAQQPEDRVAQKRKLSGENDKFVANKKK